MVLIHLYVVCDSSDYKRTVRFLSGGAQSRICVGSLNKAQVKFELVISNHVICA